MKKGTQDTLPPNRGGRKNGRLHPTSLFINRLQYFRILTLEDNFWKMKKVKKPLEVWLRDGCFFIGQEKNVVEILKRFRMEDCKPMAIPLASNWRKIDASGSDGFDPTLYRQLIKSLMYLVNTRLDISFVFNSLSQFMVDPQRVHWTASKHILRYIKGTVEYGLVYERKGSVQLARFPILSFIRGFPYPKCRVYILCDVVNVSQYLLSAAILVNEIHVWFSVTN